MLKLYENIKNRRIELNMTQDELADKMGYKGKSMISKIENGLVDISRSKIESFADVLETTPAYLMGWTDDVQDPGNPIDMATHTLVGVAKDPEMLKALAAYLTLSKTAKRHVIETINLLSGSE